MPYAAQRRPESQHLTRGERRLHTVEMGEPAETAAAIAESAQAVTKLRTEVTRVPEGSLPNDGKVIEDRRPIG